MLNDKRPAGLAAKEACHEIHLALEALPLLASPAEVPFRDGLYFFYEVGERSEHAADGRVVRVGNHPNKQGALVSRLSAHYTGNKNSSVFRKFLGGALLRRRDPDSPCLAPSPGKGHWEHQKSKACERCKPLEQKVSQLLRSSFRFRCVEAVDQAERNELERVLIATLAACPVCGPSATWLGHYAYSDKVRWSGLWNSDHVGGATITARQLERLRSLAHASVEAFECRRDAMSEKDASDVLLLIPCCASKNRSDHSPCVKSAPLLEEVSNSSVAVLEEGQRQVADKHPKRFDLKSPLLPAMVWYTGIMYETPGFRDALDAAFKRGLHCLIVSAGYGLLRPDDPIHYYNVKMSDKGIRKIWKGRLPQILADYVSRNGVRRVFGALSKDYYRVVAEAPNLAPGAEFRWHVPCVPHGKGHAPQREVPKALGNAVIHLIASGFSPHGQWSQRPACDSLSARGAPLLNQSSAQQASSPSPFEDGGVVSAPSKKGHTGSKYGQLQAFLGSIPESQASVSLTFARIESIISDNLPSSAKRHHQAWWANESKGSRHSQAQAWREAGWMVESVDPRGGRVTFVRIRAATGKRGM